MDNSNSNNKTPKKDKRLKNAILIISIIYFLFVLEESQDINRKRIYKLLILISSIFLFLTNFDFFKNIFNELIYLPLYKKIFTKQDLRMKDDAKRILE